MIRKQSGAYAYVFTRTGNCIMQFILDLLWEMSRNSYLGDDQPTEECP